MDDDMGDIILVEVLGEIELWEITEELSDDKEQVFLRLLGWYLCTRQARTFRVVFLYQKLNIFVGIEE